MFFIDGFHPAEQGGVEVHAVAEVGEGGGNLLCNLLHFRGSIGFQQVEEDP